MPILSTSLQIIETKVKKQKGFMNNLNILLIKNAEPRLKLASEFSVRR